MINKVLGTLGSQLLNSLLSFGIIIITAKQLGPVAVGTISLIILGIAWVQMINNFIGGGALVYLIPRFDTYKLFVPSYVWAFLTAILFTYLFKILNMFPPEYFRHVLFLSLMLSLTSINLTILLGKEKVRFYNIISSLQTVILIGVLCVMVFQFHKKEVFSYILALYFSYGFALVASSIASFPLVKITNLKDIGEVLKNILKFGFYVQLANSVQLFNYRMPFYFVKKFINMYSLGIYTVGVQLSESLWLMGKSMSIVQYSKISNTQDIEYARKITLVFGKISFLFTFVMLIVLMTIPYEIFSSIFGKDFSSLPTVIISLAAGILFLSLSFSISHYFSGIGKHYHNSISSSIGFVFTIVLGYILIPRFGLIGAGITTSIAYFFILVYQVFFFMKVSKSKVSDILVTTKDIKFFISEIKNRFRKDR
jgi:O-antigen/teichoic acid export membrane protein